MTEALLQEAAAFLEGGAWNTRFEPEALAQGQRLARRRTCSAPQVEPLEPDNLILRAQVADEDQHYPVELVLWPERGIWQLETTCPCPQRQQCRHAAALLASLPNGPALIDLLAGRLPQSSENFASAIAANTTAHVLPPGARPAAVPDADLPALQLPPRFHLSVRREPLPSPAARRFVETLSAHQPEHWLVARAQVHYGEHSLPLLKPGQPAQLRVHNAQAQPQRLERNAAAEDHAVAALRRAGLIRLNSHPLWRRLHHGRPPGDDLWLPEPGPQDELLAWAEFRRSAQPQLQAQGWQIDFPASFGARLIVTDPEQWRARLEAQSDGWFSLSVGFEVDGQNHNLLPLLALLLSEGLLQDTQDQPHSTPLLIPLPQRPGEVLQIPLGRLRRILRQLFAALHPGQGSRSPLDAQGRATIHALDAAALSENPDLPLDPPPVELLLLQQALDAASHQTEERPPAQLRAELRPYQLDGYRWMQRLARANLHGILADDMGLGKTLQTLAHLLRLKEQAAESSQTHSQDSSPDHSQTATPPRPSLVVAPTSVIPNWLAEARRFAPSLRVLDATGPQRARVLPHLQHADLVLTSYALLHRDLPRLAAQEFQLLVLDEAQYIKNPDSQAARAARQLRARHRLCLSGTPIENHLEELWSLQHFLQPGLLGSRADFNHHYRQPIEKQGDADRASDLQQRLSPLILRRTKAQVATELPPKTELIHSIELEPAQKDLYEGLRASMDREVRQALALRGNDGTQMLFLSALLKLRQVCCDPRLLKPPPGGPVPSAKLDYLLELLDQLRQENSRILLFSQFTSMLALIQAELTAKNIPHLLLTGASQDRGQLVEKFQSGAYPIFLISLKAGGTGLNLTAADTVIHYDPWWNPAAEAQATDRAYRIGQTRPVFVHKLLTRDSVEEKIHKLQQTKQTLANTLSPTQPIQLDLNPTLIDEILAP